MELDTFAFVHDNVYKNFLNSFDNFSNWKELKKAIQNQFEKAYDNKEIYYSNEMKNGIFSSEKETASFVWLNTKLKDKDAEFIWCKFKKNTLLGHQEWFGIEFFKESDMIMDMLRAKNYIVGNIIFNNFNSIQSFLECLKSEVQEEEWKYKNYSDSSMNYPILKSYIEHTCIRLKEENKIIKSDDKNLVVFNTGLLQKDFLLDTYIYCELSEMEIFGLKCEIFKNPNIIFEDDPIIRKKFNSQKPMLASYFSKIDEVIFNPELDIDLNWKHIFIQRKERIPNGLYKDDKDLKEIVRNFKGNEESLKKLAKRNYKMVIPQYYDHNVQFLMPIYLGTTFTGTPDFALVLDYDNSNNQPFYKGTTILTVEMAYQNARLIAKPENPWLTSTVE